MYALILAVACSPFVNQDEATSVRPDSSQIESLRDRIHEMRTNLVVGGKNVRDADSEAIEFYNKKIDTLDLRSDQILSELTEKKAAYAIALDRALEAASASSRRSATADAARLRLELTELEVENRDLDEKRAHLQAGINVVRSRERERARLAAQFETSSVSSSDFGMPFASGGLKPSRVPIEASALLDDEVLVMDLISRDPRGARQIFFEDNPGRYWERFPLQPSVDALWDAFEFPTPDLPGQR